MKVKICGNASLNDLKIALSAGADAVGFITGTNYKSEDAVTKSCAKKLVLSLPPFVASVAVTHLQNPQDLIDIIDETGCSTLQIQNDVSLEDMDIVKNGLPHTKIIKAVHVTGIEAIEKAEMFSKTADAIILDTKTETRIGGTGITHDWNISAEIVKRLNKPVILAGGLSPSNLAEAIEKVKPYAVDVHSGVKKNGARDFYLTKSFVDIAHSF